MEWTDNNKAFAAGMLCGGAMLFVVCGVYCFAMQDEYRRDAIRHGAAEYDTTTGAWRWKGPILPAK